LSHRELGGEVGINDDFAGGSQPVLTFGCGFEGVGCGWKPLCLARFDARQCDLNSSDRIGGHDNAVKLVIADVLAAAVLSCHANQHPLGDLTLCKLEIEPGATIVEIGRVWHSET